MSGLIVSTTARSEGLLSRAREIVAVAPNDAWLPAPGAGDWLQVARCDDPLLWGPASISGAEQTVALAGRIALSPAEWDRAKRLPIEGGLACRHILAGVQAEGSRFWRRLNGAFCIAHLIWGDHGVRQVSVVTDRMGYFPAYQDTTRSELTLATHPDAVAALIHPTPSFDLTTMAEMLSHWNAAHPYTYHAGVEQLNPGSIYVWTPEGGLAQARYWQPGPNFSATTSTAESAEELAAALTRAVRLRSHQLLGPVGLFLSAGADSRAVLFAAERPSEIRSFTFFDRPNEELAVARELAALAGSPHTELPRNEEHYGVGAPRAARVLGGMWNVLDAHYTEFLPAMAATSCRTFLSGCSADYLFKGIAQDRTPRTIFGKWVPVFRPTSFSHQWTFTHAQVRTSWQSEVERRCGCIYEGLDLTDESPEGRWWRQLRRVWPISRVAMAGTRLLLLRTLPWDPVLADVDVLEMFCRIPPRQTLNGGAWRQAVRRVAFPARRVVDNNTGARVGSSELSTIVAYCTRIARRKLAAHLPGAGIQDAVATTGSWPNFTSYVVHSRVLPSLWGDATSEQRDLLSELLGFDPFALPPPAWTTRDVQLFFRILTLKLWLDGIRDSRA